MFYVILVIHGLVMFSPCLVIFTLIDLNFNKVLQVLRHYPFMVTLDMVKNVAVLMIHMQ